MIYVVRHGETDWNLENRCQGWTDTELNQTGLKQAEELAKRMSGIKFDVCFSSTQKRAFKTAQIIYHGKIIVDQRIRERGKGELEGRTDVKEIIKQQDINFYDPNESRYGIEKLSDFQNRICSFWNDILKKYIGKNVLVVTHGGTARWSRVFFDGMPVDNDINRYGLKNCEVWQIDNSKPFKIK